MNPSTHPSRRRVHGAELKAKVLAQCREPGASVAAVAMANALNANLVRKWLAGRGLARSGLTVDSGEPTSAWPVAGPTLLPETSAIAAPALQFVPVSVPAQSQDDEVATVASPATPSDAAHIEVELRRGGACLAVRWPLPQAQDCTAWLRELADAMLKREASL